jgi:ABC-2 type transport system permease protein
MKKNGFSWIRLWALVKKEFIHIIRDPRSLAMAFLMPLILLILFGYAITMDIKTLNLVVYDQDKSAAITWKVSRPPATSAWWRQLETTLARAHCSTRERRT